MAMAEINCPRSIIEIENATVFRGQTKVFDCFSLRINLGDNSAIIGPNGAGKTTLLKLLSRELYPVYNPQTRLRIFGEEKWNVWDLRAKLGIVSPDLQQNYSGNTQGIAVVLSGFYASINTWGHQRFDAEQLDKAHDIMEQLGVAHLQKKLYAFMSTGEQRRCLLARALINDPHALILDEPTTGLDLPSTFKYLDTVRGLMSVGKTVILVTHHIHEIPPEIQQIILLKNGNVIDKGGKTETLTDASLSALFQVPIKLVYESGFYQVIPVHEALTMREV